MTIDQGVLEEGRGERAGDSSVFCVGGDSPRKPRAKAQRTKGLAGVRVTGGFRRCRFERGYRSTAFVAVRVVTEIGEMAADKHKER